MLFLLSSLAKGGTLAQVESTIQTPLASMVVSAQNATGDNAAKSVLQNVQAVNEIAKNLQQSQQSVENLATTVSSVSSATATGLSGEAASKLVQTIQTQVAQGINTAVSTTDVTTQLATVNSNIANDIAKNEEIATALSIADARVTEGNTDGAKANFDVTLDKAVLRVVNVKFTVTDGTAINGTDYRFTPSDTSSGSNITITGTNVAVSGKENLVFNPGETKKTVAIAMIGDTTYEADETFTVTLSDPIGATLAKAMATGTIVNDDTQPTPTSTEAKWDDAVWDTSNWL